MQKPIGSRLTPFLLLTLLFSSCGDSDDGPMGPEPADVDSYLATMPSWTEFSPERPDVDEIAGDTELLPVETTPEGDYECTSTPYSLTRTPAEIVTLNPDTEILWPGSLLEGKGYADGLGSLSEIPVRQRAPLTISVDFLAPETTRTINNPDVASVQDAIAGLISNASGTPTASNIIFDQTEMHSLVESSIRMGLSASYYDVGVKASLEASASAEFTTVTAYFRERMFTVSTVLPQTPGSFFSDEFTEEKLQEQIDLGRIGPDNPPVYVSSVTYGRMLIFNFTSVATAAEINSTLGAMYNGGEFSAEFTQEQRAILDGATINVVALGGETSNAAALIRSGDLSSYFEDDPALTSARPISYTIRNLGDNSIAKVSETTEYNIKECTAVAAEVTGYEYTITLDKVWFENGPKARPDYPCAYRCVADGNYIFEAWTTTDGYCSIGAGLYFALCSGDRSPPLTRGNGADCASSPNPDGKPQKTFRLHYDGRDKMIISGSIQVAGVSLPVATLDKFNFNKAFTGVITPGQGSLRASKTCEDKVWPYGPTVRKRWRMEYTITRGMPLFD